MPSRCFPAKSAKTSATTAANQSRTTEPVCAKGKKRQQCDRRALEGDELSGIGGGSEERGIAMIVCATCNRAMRPKKNGTPFVGLAQDRPYKLWMADLWDCQDC